jgi:hypothetical protein
MKSSESMLYDIVCAAHSKDRGALANALETLLKWVESDRALPRNVAIVKVPADFFAHFIVEARAIKGITSNETR